MVQNLSSPQQEKVTALLNKFGVEYMAMGDFALRKYVDNKYYNNIQLWVKPTPENFQKVTEAFASVKRKFDVDEKSFTKENPDTPLMKVGSNRKTIELFTAAPGLSIQDFDKAFANRRVLTAGQVPVPVLSEKDLHRSIQSKPAVNQTTDLQMLERSVPKLAINPNTTMNVIDWKEAARKIDPHKLLSDLGYNHIPSKGLFGSSKSQTYERGDDRITVYPNPSSKPIFIDQMSGKKGDAIDLLNWQHRYDHKEVNKSIKEHFGGVAPTQEILKSTNRPVSEHKTQKLDDKTVAEIQSKDLKEKYGLKEFLTNPGYLLNRGLSLNTIFRPEFFKQTLNSLGWNSKEQKTINTENTVFPMRNDHGITTMIIRNDNFKGFPEGERRDAIWMSNPLLTLNKDIKIGQGENQVILPKGTEGSLIPVADKPGTFQFYYQDPAKAGKELSYNKFEVTGSSLEQLTKSLNPLAVNKFIVTESPIDAMSLHQLSPPKPGESRMYVSTGGQPSEKQIAYINQLVQKVHPDQIVLGNDNDKGGMKFNIAMIGGIQHPSIDAKDKFLAKINETGSTKEDEKTRNSGEYHLKIFAAKDPVEMEKMAFKITDAINRFTPKGQEPPARITYLNGAASGSEVTIAFFKNDRFLQTAQKELEKLVNENTPGKEKAVKIVQPVTKDLNEDLKQSQEQKIKVNYDLADVTSQAKTQSKNLYQQVSGLANNAFDALFGGVPGSLPKVEEAESKKREKPEQKEEPKKIPDHAEKGTFSKGADINNESVQVPKPVDIPKELIKDNLSLDKTKTIDPNKENTEASKQVAAATNVNGDKANPSLDQGSNQVAWPKNKAISQQELAQPSIVQEMKQELIQSKQDGPVKYIIEELSKQSNSGNQAAKSTANEIMDAKPGAGPVNQIKNEKEKIESSITSPITGLKKVTVEMDYEQAKAVSAAISHKINSMDSKTPQFIEKEASLNNFQAKVYSGMEKLGNDTPGHGKMKIELAPQQAKEVLLAIKDAATTKGKDLFANRAEERYLSLGNFYKQLSGLTEVVQKVESKLNLGQSNKQDLSSTNSNNAPTNKNYKVKVS